MAGLIWRILGGEFRPLCSTAKNPEHTEQHCARVESWTATVILATRGSQDWFHQLPLFVCRFPTASHACPQDDLSKSSFADIEPRNVYEMGSSPAHLPVCWTWR
jgi:hypothetical protein